MKIRKRDGSLVEFDIEKIKIAISKANNAVDPHARISPFLIDAIAQEITYECSQAAEIPTVEGVQDMVEFSLMRYNAVVVASAYIKYRQQHTKVRETKNTLIDYQKVVDNYLRVADWRVKENSTVSYSLGGLILGNSGAITANYWLSEIYDKEVADAHRNVDIHIHDLSMLSAYCAGWNLKQLIEVGISGIGGRIASKPASHLSTL